jgi:RNA polymerase sigma-70 factor (ECF subfamily)
MGNLAAEVDWSVLAMSAPGTRPETDAAPLVRSARAGNPEAFEELYRRYHRLVHGVLLARLPRGDAEDLAQEVFLAAWERLADLRNDDGFGGWVSAIARNRAASHARSRPRETSLPEDLPGGARADGSPEAVLSVIRRLPEAYREPLVLRLVHGMSGPEIARETGLTEGSVRVNLHRGFAKLRALLGGGR